MIERIEQLLDSRESVTIGIDGYICAGKTTLAAHIASELGGNVVHMDDFFLPAGERTNAPGGNIDVQRLTREVLEPLRCGGRIEYGVFDCAEQRISHKVELAASRLTIIEGSYSHLPKLAAQYDLKIFLRLQAGEQRARVLAREGEGAIIFFEEWIPREKEYFDALDIEKNSDIVL